MFLVVILTTQGSYVFAQNYRHASNNSFNYSESFDNNGADNYLVLKNTNGHINIKGYDGNEIKIVVEQELRAKTKSDLAQAESEIKLKIENYGDEITVYTVSPDYDHSTGITKSTHSWFVSNESYSHRHDFKIMVPRNTNLIVNNQSGHIENIKNISAKEVEVSNNSGHVNLTINLAVI